MCDAALQVDVIEWRGWTTTWADLRAAGWTISRKAANPNWRCASTRENEIYIRHDELCYVGRLTLSLSKGERVASLDYLTHERNGRKKPKPVYYVELTAADIPDLYAAILNIQQQTYRKPPRPDNVIPITGLSASRR